MAVMHFTVACYEISVYGVRTTCPLFILSFNTTAHYCDFNGSSHQNLFTMLQLYYSHAQKEGSSVSPAAGLNLIGSHYTISDG